MIGVQTSRSRGFRSWWDPPGTVTTQLGLAAEMAYCAQGGAVVLFQESIPEALFELGPIEVTNEAMKALERAKLHAWPLLLRHVAGESAPDPTTARLNREAIQRKEGRVVSAFQTSSTVLWIITHLGEGGYTTFLVSETA